MTDGPPTPPTSRVHQIKTVVQWRHSRSGEEAHCLGRLLIPRPPARMVAVLSEVRSNPTGRGVTDDFANVAEAALAQWVPQIAAPLPEIVWVAHHGSFSYYYAYGPDTFTRVDLQPGNREGGDLSGHHLLAAHEVDELLAGAALEPVPQVLAELGWPY